MEQVHKFIETQVAEIKKKVGDEGALVAFSGGVDSSVTAVLAAKTLRHDQLKLVTIDDGLRREKEPEMVQQIFKVLEFEVEIIDNRERTFEVLAGIRDGEERRRIFRDESFYPALSEVARRDGRTFLLQGTNKADLVTTRSGLQTQHNILTKINTMKKWGFKPVEPLISLVKYEIRDVARQLHVPEVIRDRKPFPGPGLALRVLEPVTPENISIVRKATRIIEDELRFLHAFQELCCLIAPTFGIRGKERFSGYILAVKAVKSLDALTAEAIHIPETMWEGLTKRLVNEIPKIARVVYEATNKPPSSIEFI